MKAEKDKVVTFHYRLTDEAGDDIDSSHEREPLADHCSVTARSFPDSSRRSLVTSPAIASMSSCRRNRPMACAAKDFTQRVPKKYFRDGDRLQPGMTTVLNTQDGHRSVTVIKVGSSVIDVDLNHPMAGKTLHFAIEISRRARRDSRGSGARPRAWARVDITIDWSNALY